MRRLLLAVFLVVAIAPASAAGAGWLGPDPLGTSSGDILTSADPPIAQNARGEAVALLARTPDGRPLVRRAAPGRSFGAARLLPGGAMAADGAVAIDPHATAVVAWQRFDGSDPTGDAEECCFRVVAAVQGANGRAGPVRRLSEPLVYAADVAVAVRGTRAAVAWSGDPGRLSVATAGPGHRFGRSRSLGGDVNRTLGAWLDGGAPHVLVASDVRHGLTIEERWRAGGRLRRRVLLEALPQGPLRVSTDSQTLRAVVGPDGDVGLVLSLGGAAFAGYAPAGARLRVHRVVGGVGGPDGSIARTGHGAIAAYPAPRGHVALLSLGPDGSVASSRRILLGSSRRAPMDIAVAGRPSRRAVVVGPVLRGSRTCDVAATVHPASVRRSVLACHATDLTFFGVNAFLDGRGRARAVFSDPWTGSGVRAYRTAD